MGQDNMVLVCIATKGILDKYTSKDPTRRAELQRSFEMAAYKFAQVSLGHELLQKSLARYCSSLDCLIPRLCTARGGGGCSCL